MEKVKFRQIKSITRNKINSSKIRAVALSVLLMCSLTGCAILQEQALQEEAQESFTYEQFSEKKENDRLDILQRDTTVYIGRRCVQVQKRVRKVWNVICMLRVHRTNRIWKYLRS